MHRSGVEVLKGYLFSIVIQYASLIALFENPDSEQASH